MSKHSEYEFKINTTYLRTAPSEFPDREKNPEEGKCNNFNDRKNGGVPTWIMEHHTVSDLSRSLEIFLKGAASPHYMITPDGTVYHMVPDANRAYHAGPGSLKSASKFNSTIPDELLRGTSKEGELGKGTGDMNSWSIGIENVNDAVTPFPLEQTVANIYLHEMLVTEHGISPKNLISHADWAPGRKIDPSPYYDWRALATASEKYEDIEHNFGVYPTQVTLKSDPEIIVSYDKTGSKEDIGHMQTQLAELGYSCLKADGENLGVYDVQTQAAAFSFTIRFMNEIITGDESLVKLWNVCCNDKVDQTDARGIISTWTQNHDVVISEVLDLYGEI